MRIKKIKRVSFEGTVYNLKVKDDESYTANSIIVHNCRCIIAYIGEDELPDNWVPDYKRPSPEKWDELGRFKAPHPDSITSFIKTKKGRKIVEAKAPVPAKMKYDEWRKTITKEEKDAINFWKSNAYGDVKNYQRTGKGTVNTKSIAKEIEKALDRDGAFEGTIYRGLFDISPKKIEILKKSKRLTWDSLSSGTKDKKIAKRISTWSSAGNKGVIFEIKNKTGVDIGKIGILGEEKEVLMRQGAKYKVVKTIEKKVTYQGLTKDILHITLEEI